MIPMKDSNKVYRPRKPMPVPVIVVVDILILAVIMSWFCYEHHIKSLWGLDSSAEKTGMHAVDASVDASADVLADPADMGDFGANFPHVFLQSGDTVLMENDAEIRAYLNENKLALNDGIDCVENNYISLYRSNDIFMTGEKISTNIIYNSKNYYVTYYYYDVYVKNIENLYTVAVDDREPMEDLALSSYEIRNAEGDAYITDPAVFAINGDYWGNENLSYFVVRNNNILRDSDYIGADICVLYNDGTMETMDMTEFNRGEIMSKNPYQIWEFGPSLLDENGNAIYEFDERFYDDDVLTSRHPRSSIGYYEPGHYCFIVVDGRSEESKGVRLFQLGEFYEMLGCKVAYNFDGGDSAQSFFNGQHHRTDEARRLEGDDQRKLYDIVCVGEVRKSE